MARDHTHPNEAKVHPEDGKVGDWSSVRLQRMDHKFTEALKREKREQPAPPHKDKAK